MLAQKPHVWGEYVIENKNVFTVLIPLMHFLSLGLSSPAFHHWSGMQGSCAPMEKKYPPMEKPTVLVLKSS